MRAPAAVPPLLLAPLLAAAMLPAQGGGDYAFNKQTPGTLGQNLVLDYAGANTGGAMLFMLSLNAGPTPLPPPDPRTVAVGLELIAGWFSFPVTQSSGQISLPVPVLATLSGVSIHFQTLTAPGATFLVDQISDKVIAQLGASGTPEPLPAQLVAARALAATFFDRDNDSGAGDVIVAGGGQGTLLGAVGLVTTELYHFQTMTVTAGPVMTSARALAAVTPLGDGRVLLTGGVDAMGNVLSSAEVYDPQNDTFTAAGNMSVPRAGHAAARLPNGRVLVVGGTTTFADPLSALAGAQQSAEEFDPGSGQFSGLRSMPRALIGPGLTALNSGRVLLSGGFQVIFVLGAPIPLGSTAACSLYDRGANAWSPAASMRTARGAHGPAIGLLDDGRVLVTGGASAGPDLTQAAAIPNAEVYGPGDAWAGLPDMARARALHSATRLPGGRVVVAGGADGTITAPNPHRSVQEFDPVTNGWRTLPDLSTPRAGHAAAVTPDGLLVLLGGQGAGGSTTIDTVETVHR